jgi:hypothetical protein
MGEKSTIIYNETKYVLKTPVHFTVWRGEGLYSERSLKYESLRELLDCLSITGELSRNNYNLSPFFYKINKIFLDLFIVFCHRKYSVIFFTFYD